MTSITSPFNAWVKCLTPNPDARIRLFCFHYAGGSALSFRAWSAQLPNTVECCFIELPGHGIRLMEPAIDRLPRLIQALKPAILPSLTKPFAFFGHSMGALVAYELAQALRDHSLTPIHLFVSGHRAPHLPDADPPAHALPDSDFLAALRRYNGTPETVLQNTELMELLLPTLRADFAVIETYRHIPAPCLDCPIAAFGGLEDWKTSTNDLDAWRLYTTAAFSLDLFPGDHFFIHSHQSSVLHSLSTILNQRIATLSI